MSARPAASGIPLRFLIFLGFGILFFVLPGLVSLGADWLWFTEVGFLPVLTLNLTAQTALGIGVFLLAAAWLGWNLRAALAPDVAHCNLCRMHRGADNSGDEGGGGGCGR